MKVNKNLDGFYEDGVPLIKGGQGRTNREMYGAAIGAFWGFVMTLALALLVFCVWVLYRAVMG